uniref:Nudix hydrolase domain-containing protein n=1 Tax=Trieres chinensis TaxID=1514140 RepID=A0A7S2EIG7_TRICV|mmetsp:Transcript_25619/g.52439  ORF Transcript_25619/g.52439 Transcript_25619/m.52439 type:complete len:277 (+) Transcript_25619:73-903(+)
MCAALHIILLGAAAGVGASAPPHSISSTAFLVSAKLFQSPRTTTSAHFIRTLTQRSMSASVSAVSGEGGESAKSAKLFPPSRCVVDESGGKWRLCAAAAVLSSASSPLRLLLGERITQPGSWQCPQGGVDDVDPASDIANRRTRSETVMEAAGRELYEEMGLVVGQHVEPVPELCGTGDYGEGGVMPVRYPTAGTGSWLEKNGYAGQELRWAVFRCIDDDLMEDPSNVCDLGGKGEGPEFIDVKWEDLDKSIEGVWEKKRGPYKALGKFLREKGYS